VSQRGVLVLGYSRPNIFFSLILLDLVFICVYILFLLRIMFALNATDRSRSGICRIRSVTGKKRDFSFFEKIVSEFLK
jgi:hypothetical protein